MATQYKSWSQAGDCFLRCEVEIAAGRRTLWNRTRLGQAQERELEAQADSLLKSAPPSANYPAYTEFQLARHGEGIRLPFQDEFVDTAAAMQTRQDFLSDLHFMAGLTPLTRMERYVLDAWMGDLSQGEIIAQWPRVFGPVQQQRVSRLLKKALQKCHAAWDLSFTQFSRHTIYRRPARNRDRQPRMTRRDAD